MTYNWTDDAMKSGNPCDVDKANANLMHLKYDNVYPQDGKIPYSVASGKVDANGYASFITKNSDTQITVQAGGSNPNLVIAYPDGSVESVSSDIVVSSLNICAGTISGITHTGAVANATTSAAHGLTTGDSVTIAGATPTQYNGTFSVTVTDSTHFTYTMSGTPGSNASGTITYSVTGTIIKEKGNNTPIIVYGANTVSEGYVAPAGNNGDYFLNIGVRPMQATKKASGSWTNQQFVKLGEFTKTSGTMATPISYAFNGKFISMETTITANSTALVSHNLGLTPRSIQALIVCKTPELNFAVNDVVDVSNIFAWMVSSGANNTPVFADKLNIGIRVSNNAVYTFYLYNKTTSAGSYITASNWRLLFIAERGF